MNLITIPTQWQQHTFRLGETVEAGAGKKAVIADALGRTVKIRFDDGHTEARFVEQIEKAEAVK
ncbi:hypothetical protein AGMMS49991_06810 [Spirochaetia bacterium]|nr:hypothetical protein AGMMS49991_06810 [Spirochaetia bacterium]